MKYTIISINDDRLENKQNIHRILFGNYTYTNIPAFNALEDDWREEFERLGISMKEEWQPERGEMGAFISHYRTWLYAAEHGELLTFEDDAILADDFPAKHRNIVTATPSDFDFISLWVPPNQLNHYNELLSVHPEGMSGPILLGRAERNMFDIGNEYVCNSYQGYGHVATMYSQQGAMKLLDIVDEYGVYATVDCLMHFQALAGRLSGYAPLPYRNNLVTHDFEKASTVHGTGH